ncbi:MAG: FMN reductase, partial [Rhodobacterales bacterium]
MSDTPKIALIIGSTRATRFADKPAQWMLKQAK